MIKSHINTMFNSCVYAVNNQYYADNRASSDSRELCTGGQIVVVRNNQQCLYGVGGILRQTISPLVLDLKGDGFKYTSVENGVVFDLNNDGVLDYVIGIKGNDHTPGSIAIYNGTEKGFGVVSGGGILQSLCLHVKDLMNLSITDKGVLRIETVYEGESTTTLVYMVRYEEGDYYLIGGKDDMDGNATSYNFLTGKKAVGKQTFDLPDRPLIPFARLNVGYFERGGEIFQEIE